MATMKPMTPKGEEFFRDAPEIVRASVAVRATPERIFGALANARSWERWFPLMRECAWLEGATGGIGAEREVNLLALGRYREKMIVWEENARFAFTIVASSGSMAEAATEDFQIQSDGPKSSIVSWQFAASPRAWVKPALPLMRLGMTRLFLASGPRLEKYLHQS